MTVVPVQSAVSPANTQSSVRFDLPDPIFNGVAATVACPLSPSKLDCIDAA